MFKDAFSGLSNKKVALYVSGHRFPFFGIFKKACDEWVILETSESNEHFFFIRDIVSFFEYKENKKFI